MKSSASLESLNSFQSSSSNKPGEGGIRGLMSRMKDKGNRNRSSSNPTGESKPSRANLLLNRLPDTMEASDNNLGRNVRVKGVGASRTFGKLQLIQSLNADSNNDVQRSIKRNESMGTLASHDDLASSNSVWILRFNPSGNYMAAGRQDGSVVIWESDTTTGKDLGVGIPQSQSPAESNGSLRRSSIPNSSVESVDGSHLDPDIAPVFMTSPIQHLKGHKQAITDLSWSSGNFLISASSDNSVRLWHVSNENCLCVFEHTDTVSSVRFHPFNDNYFASGTLDGRTRVWDIRNRKLLYWNEIPRESITALSFTRDASAIVVGTLSGNCIFYDFAGLKYITQINVASSKGVRSRETRITGIEKVPESAIGEERILVTSADSRIRLINVKDKSLHRTYKGFDLKNSKCFASFSTDGQFIISPSDEKQIVIWDSLPPDGTVQQYSNVLSSVIHRRIEISRSNGQERFLASNHSITCAVFLPKIEVEPTSSEIENAPDDTKNILVVSDIVGHVFVYRTHN